MIIAITGGYGSGKSCVSRLLASSLDATLTNLDSLCRRLLEPQQEAFVQMGRVFGDRFLAEDGTIDRVLLRKVTFSDDTIKSQLEQILHPLVRDKVRKQAKICSQKNSFLVVEVPLLFEVGWQDDFDVVVVVRVTRETSIQRAVKRDGIGREEAERIIALQLPMSCKEPLADYIIDNNSIFISTAQQVAWLATNLSAKSIT